MIISEKIGILGGTFNPIHNGHINIALDFKKQLSLDKVIFVPTFVPPHKSNKDVLSVDVRLNMCKIALSKYSCFDVSDVEASRHEISFTYRTLELLKEKYKLSKFFLLMGADMFLTVQSWKNSKKIFDSCIICTVPREGCSFSVLKDHKKVLDLLGAQTVIIKAPIKNVSSTKIREKIRARQNFSDLVPLNLKDYIVKNKLYVKSCILNN